MKIYILTHFSEIDPNAFSSQLDIQGLENTATDIEDYVSGKDPVINTKN